MGQKHKDEGFDGYYGNQYNPYHPGTEEFDDWQEGFLEAENDELDADLNWLNRHGGA